MPDLLKRFPQRGGWRGPWIGWVIGVLFAALLVLWVFWGAIEDFGRGIVP